MAELTDEQIDAAWQRYDEGIGTRRELAMRILALSATGAEDAELIAWEAPEGLGIVRFVSDRRYRLFSPKIRAWYKPYRCSQCAARSLKETK